MNKIPPNWVIQRISDMLEQRNWTIYRLAKQSELPYSSLNNLFVRNTMPTISTLMKICKGLNVTMSEFFADEIPPCSEINKLAPDELAVLEKYRKLSNQDKNLLQAYITGLAKLSN